MAVKQTRLINGKLKLPVMMMRRRGIAAPAAPTAAGRHRRRLVVRNYCSWEEKFKVRAVRLKREMKEISKDQELIGMQQRVLRTKIENLRHKCSQIRQESEHILKKQASNQLLLQLMFNILRARDNGDSVEAATATAALREVMAKMKSGEDIN